MSLISELQAKFGCVLPVLARECCDDCDDGPELLRRCLGLWEEDKGLQAYRFMSRLEQVDAALFAGASTALAPLQRAVEEVESLRMELDSVEGWHVVRQGSLSGGAKIEYRCAEGPDTHSLRVDCEVEASLEDLLITLNEVKHQNLNSCVKITLKRLKMAVRGKM